MRVGFFLNNERFVIDVPIASLLLDVLRHEFGIKSIHAGCQKGQCGSCLVLINDVAVPSCLIPIFSCRDGYIETIEGVLAQSDFADIEKGFQRAGLIPCTLCVSSKIILAESLLRVLPEADLATITSSIPVHWCTCCSADAFTDAVIACQELRRKRKKHASSP